jgi:hypothetical protein
MWCLEDKREYNSRPAEMRGFSFSVDNSHRLRLPFDSGFSIVVVQYKRSNKMEAIGYIEIPVRAVGGKFVYAKVDADYDGEYFAQYKWRLNPKLGYAWRWTKDEAGRRVPSYLHHEVCWAPKGYWRDHINRDRLDNRSCNLRVVTPRQSAANRSTGKRRSKSGFRGVHNATWHYNGENRVNKNLWVACCSGRYLGTFSTGEAAARAYDKAAKDRWGSLATLNFPEAVS